LDRRTEGWIAGLQLAAHSLLHQENRQDFLAAFAGDDRFVADYLIEEVLATQPAVVQDFLLQSAILDNLTAPLCDAVTGQSDSQAILTSLEQANLFIVPLDNRRQWYRYHQLFADLLRERLSESGRSVSELHARASRWYAANGFHAPAIDHALEAGDPAEAVRLIEETAQAFFIGSELTTLTRWWPRLPAEFIAWHPRLAMAYAWAFLATGQPTRAEACLQSVEQAIGSPMTALVGKPAMATSLPDSVAAVLAEVTIVRVSLAMGELDLARASQLAQAVLPYLEIDPEVFLFNRPDDLRTVVMFTSGLVQLYTGELDAATISLRDAWHLARSQGNVHLAALAVGNLASLQLIRGQFRQVEETCELGARALAEMAWSSSPMTGVIYAHWGSACYARNDLVAARAHFQEAVRLAEPWGNWEALQPSYLGLSRLCRAEGDWPAAFDALDSLERHATGAMASAQPQVEAIRALYLAERGDPSRLNRWVQRHEGEFDGAALLVQEDASILLARMLFAYGDVDAAAELLSSLLAGAEAGGRWGRALDILVLQALLHAAEDRTELAQATLGKALRLAEPEGAIRPFVDAGQPMAELLRLALRSGVSPDTCHRLLAVFPGPTQVGPEPGPQSPKSSVKAIDGGRVLVESLTEREVQVLALLAQGHSNKTIARKLVLTEGTVKTHAHNIYAKLAVSTRGEAVARARTLGILA
jgi:LuxR family maltose regulon positive regulatory protein